MLSLRTRIIQSSRLIGTLGFLVVFGASSVVAGPLSVRPKTSSLASVLDACPTGFQTVFRNVANRQAEKHARAARNHVESKLLLLIHKEEEHLLKYDIALPARGLVEPLPEELVPMNAKLAEIADRASQILQSRTEMLDFVESMAREAKTARTAGWSPGVDPVTLLSPEQIETSVFQRVAERMGWGPIVPIRNPVDDGESFRTQVLGSSKLFYDVEAVGSMHTASAHFLQWLMVTPKLESEFGPGSAKLLLKHFSTAEGIRLWGWMFDRGPSSMRDFRSPRAFYELRLVGDQSWFGVR